MHISFHKGTKGGVIKEGTLSHSGKRRQRIGKPKTHMHVSFHKGKWGDTQKPHIHNSLINNMLT
jgi:hypothetical protein